MAYQSDVVSGNEAPPVPTAKFERGLIPRHAAKLNTTLRDTASSAMHGLAGQFDKAMGTLDTSLRGHNWTPAGREYAISQARTQFETDTQAVVDQLTKHANAHAEQLRTELSTVPEPSNWFAIDRIWRRLDAMSDSEVDAYLRRTDDPQVVAAVVHAPTAFPIGSEAARRVMMTNYARTHRAAQWALLQDNETYVEVIQEFRDALTRRFRDDVR